MIIKDIQKKIKKWDKEIQDDIKNTENKDLKYIKELNYDIVQLLGKIQLFELKYGYEVEIDIKKKIVPKNWFGKGVVESMFEGQQVVKKKTK